MSCESDFVIIKVNIYNNEISHHLSSQRFFFVLINLSAKMRLSKEQLNNATYPKCLVQKFWTIYGTLVQTISKIVLFWWVTSGGLSKEKQKKYVNIGTSLVHSILTGVGSIIAFYRHPSLMEDLIHFQSDFAYKLAQLSLGYFIYDFYDCARICNFKLR